LTTRSDSVDVQIADGAWGAVIAGGVAYGLGAPIAHWVRGEVELGFASLALHVLGGGLAVGSEFGLLSGDSGRSCTGWGSIAGPTCSLTPWPAALVGAAVFAIPTVIDSLFMSTPHAKHDWPAQSAWVPTFRLGHGGGVAGVAVTF
jgi:hypothetical protein